METLGIELVKAIVVTGVIGYLIHLSRERLSTEIKASAQRAEAAFRSRHEWKEKCLAELLGPLVIRLGETSRAFDRWTEPNLYLERCVLEGNRAVRALLLEKGHLIAPQLRKGALDLIEHYDVWLEEYERERGKLAAGEQLPYVFAGPKGFGFPQDAEKGFQDEFERLWKEFYSEPSSHSRETGGARSAGSNSAAP